jgi:hypothetical protein
MHQKHTHTHTHAYAHHETLLRPHFDLVSAHFSHHYLPCSLPALLLCRRFGRAMGMREALASSELNSTEQETTLQHPRHLHRHGFVNIRLNSADPEPTTPVADEHTDTLESEEHTRDTSPASNGAVGGRGGGSSSSSSEDTDTHSESDKSEDALKRRQRERMMSTRRKTASLTELPPGLVEIPLLCYSDPNPSVPGAPSGSGKEEAEGQTGEDGHAMEEEKEEEEECTGSGSGDGVGSPLLQARRATGLEYSFAGTDSDSATEPILFLSPHSAFYTDYEQDLSSDGSEESEESAPTPPSEAGMTGRAATRRSRLRSVDDLLGMSNPTDAGTSADDSISLDVASLVATIDSVEPVEQGVDSGTETQPRARLVLSRQATISSLTASALVDPSRLNLLRRVAAHRRPAPAPPRPGAAAGRAGEHGAAAAGAGSMGVGGGGGGGDSVDTVCARDRAESAPSPGGKPTGTAAAAEGQRARLPVAAGQATAGEERKRAFTSSSASLSITALREAASAANLMRTSSTMRKENEELWNLVNANLDGAQVSLGGGDDSSDSSDNDYNDTDEDHVGDMAPASMKSHPAAPATSMQLSSSYLLNSTDIVIDEKGLVGHGTFGSVYRGYLHGKLVAIKKITGDLRSIELLNDFEQEVCVNM